MAYVRVSVSRVLTVISLALGFCVTAESAPKYKVLHSFIVSDGSGPYGGVVLGQGGDLYGTTVGGGLGKCGLYNCGTVFRLTPQANGKWAESVLYSFQGGYDGADPLSSLILDAFGNIYGTATGGGPTVVALPSSLHRPRVAGPRPPSTPSAPSQGARMAARRKPD